MRKLDLSNYETKQKVRGGDGQIIEVEATYNVKDSVINVMFLPALQLMGATLVKQNLLAMKIEQAKDEVMLEEEEYERLKKAVEAYPAQGRMDVEFVDRILNQTPQLED